MGNSNNPILLFTKVCIFDFEIKGLYPYILNENYILNSMQPTEKTSALYEYAFDSNISGAVYSNQYIQGYHI